MKKLLILIIAGITGWFIYTRVKDQKKPDNMVTQYADTLKSSSDKAEDAKDLANLAVIRSAISRFRGSQGRYPDSLDELKSKGYVDRVPQGIAYDKETGEVK